MNRIAATDDDIARQLAFAAGQLLLKLQEEYRNRTPQERSEAGDRSSHEFLLGELARRRPGDAILSEEGRDDQARLSSDRVWILDPLDGTREYSELGRDDWAVQVALWQSGCLVAGAIALPARSAVLHTPSVPLVPFAGGRPRIVVSRTRPPAFAGRLKERLGGDLVAMGSVGAKVASILYGTADIYIHTGGQYEWDSAAPVAVAIAAGLYASRISGSRLEYNQPNPFLPDILVCRPQYAKLVLSAVSPHK